MVQGQISSAPSPPPAAEADGRRLRRDRNRDAVVQALLGLYREGVLDPSIDEIAARSGVSARSVFRYFDDVDSLADAAITHQLLDVAHLLPLSTTPADALPARVAAAARQRAALFEAIGSAGIVSRLKAPFNHVVAERLRENRASLRHQLAALFAAELASAPAHRLAALDVLTSFESWQLLRHDQGLSPAEAEGALCAAITELLEAHS